MSETLDMRKIVLSLLGVLVVVCAGLWLNWHLQAASHVRDWQPIYAKLPTVSKKGAKYQLSNVRDWDYGADQSVTPSWLDVTIDPSELLEIYFLVEPFGALDAVAHTMLAFEFKDGSGYVASVEARRTVGQSYGGIKAGFWPMHEYMFVWATERDMYGNSTFLAGDALYRYHLDLSDSAKQAVLSVMLEETAAIAAEPRFYNTFFSNCTNVLARAVNEVSDDALPWHISWHLPGYAAEFLHEQGFILAENGFEALQNSAHITPIVAELYDIEDPIEFSIGLRKRLENN